jgi:hypothetical protein
MARPERNNVDYFPFICEDGNKMFYIEETYGNDGFATFVKLLRELAKTNYHYLDLSKPTTVMFLSAKCKVSKETLLAIINDLVELGKFDSILWRENKIIWCQDFIDSIQDAYNKRNNKCITYLGLIQLLMSLGIRKQGKGTLKVPLNPQSKVKENKEEEIIENKSKNFEFYQDLIISQSWLESTAMQSKQKLKIHEVKKYLLEFTNDCDLRFDIKPNKKEFESHFIRWLAQKEINKPQRIPLKF